MCSKCVTCAHVAIRRLNCPSIASRIDPPTGTAARAFCGRGLPCEGPPRSSAWASPAVGRVGGPAPRRPKSRETSIVLRGRPFLFAVVVVIAESRTSGPRGDRNDTGYREDRARHPAHTPNRGTHPALLELCRSSPGAEAPRYSSG